MFRASNAHLQEDTFVHMQHMVLSLAMRVLGGLSVHSLSENCSSVYRQATKNSHRQCQYNMLHVHNCILLKMSNWGSKHVEENIVLWINSIQCIKLVINTRVGTLIVATIYLQLIQNRYMFRSFNVLQCSHQHCVQTVASDVEVVGYL